MKGIWLLVLSFTKALSQRADYLLGQALDTLCKRISDLINCEYFQPSTDLNLRSKWLESGIFAETRSSFFRCCHLRATHGILDLNFTDNLNLRDLIATDEDYVAAFARNFHGSYLDVGSGSDVEVCKNAKFPGLGISVEPSEFLADKIPSECPHVRALIGNQNGDAPFYEINFQALQALYEEQGLKVPTWMTEASSPVPIFRVLKENAVTREIGTFVEDLYLERRSAMVTIRSILELANISDRKLLIRLRAGGLEPILIDEILEINPEIFILNHEFMELLDLAKIVQVVPGDCAISMRYLFCTKNPEIFESVFFDTRSLLRTLDI